VLDEVRDALLVLLLRDAADVDRERERRAIFRFKRPHDVELHPVRERTGSAPIAWAEREDVVPSIVQRVRREVLPSARFHGTACVGIGTRGNAGGWGRDDRVRRERAGASIERRSESNRRGASDDRDRSINRSNEIHRARARRRAPIDGVIGDDGNDVDVRGEVGGVSSPSTSIATGAGGSTSAIARGTK
jgi:hypothetical protein